MPKEKRQHPRRHLIYYLKVVHPQTDELIGHLVDITPTGMMIISREPLEAGCEIPVKVLLPSIFEEARYLDLVGETVWCHKDVNPDYYAIGFKFISPAQDTVFVIQDLVDTLGFQDLAVY